MVLLVLAALWTNHLSVAPVSGTAGFVRLIRNTLLDLIRLFLVWIVTFVPLAIFLPAYQCYNDRAQVISWLAGTAEIRTLIGERIKSSGTTSHAGKGLRAQFADDAVKGLVMDSGQVIVVGRTPAAAFVLTPSLNDGTVVWTCIGLPEKLMSMECRRSAEDKGPSQ